MGNLGFQELFVLAILGGVLLGMIFYLLALQNTLKAVSPENRDMKPGNVWLLLIPIFGICYMFVVVRAISTSLDNEYKKHDVIKEENPTYNFGMAMCITEVISTLLKLFSIPYLSIICSIISFLCWLIYWVKLSEHKNEIINLQNTNDPLNY